MSPRGWIVCGALLGATGVALGAFGAHGLEKLLERQGYRRGPLPADATSRAFDRRVENFHTATRYQLLHATPIVLVGLLAGMSSVPPRRLKWAGWCLLVGTILFSGLLLLLVFAPPSWRMLGAVVPLGGAAMIAGWLLLAAAAPRER